jgi:hypothetical protein
MVHLKAALTGNGQHPAVEGALDVSPFRRHEIPLNVRALTDPESLRAAVESEFAALPHAPDLAAHGVLPPGGAGAVAEEREG